MSSEPAAPSTTEPKPEPPKGILEKLGAALPIGLTALATVFAGMSTGALQQAMYWKSQAGQDQSKATNQWTFAGFKVDRALVMQTSAAQLLVAAEGHAPEFTVDPTKPAEKIAAAWLEGEGPPDVYRRGADSKDRANRVGLPDLPSKELNDLLDMIRDRKSEDELLQKARHVSKDELNKAIDAAENVNVQITETEWGPIVSAARRMVRPHTDKAAAEAKKAAAANKLAVAAKKAAEGSMPGNKAKEAEEAAKNAAEAAKRAAAAAKDAAAAQAPLFEMDRRRYRAEAALNQEIAVLYEARVKTSSAESDKHRRKSETLFLAMLVAQIGGVTSSLAMARKHRSALWGFAAMVGLVALGVGAYGLLSTMIG